MPPKLHTKRAIISNEFIDLMVGMYRSWLLSNQSLIKQGVNRVDFQHYPRTAQRMLPIVRRASNDRAGLDYEITRLRGLPFETLDVVEDVDPYGGTSIMWLVGQTQPVTIYDFRNRKGAPLGHLGRYLVYLPETMATNPNMAHIHMIPMRNPMSISRHPHHYLSNISYSTQIDGSPLGYITGNCWGTYSGVIKRMVDLLDIPALFGQLYAHLGTYGEMPPRRIPDLDFDTTTKE